MFIIKRVQDGDTRYFNGIRRTWTSDPDNATEYRDAKEAWEDLNTTPGSLVRMNRQDQEGYSLVEL